MGDPGAILSSPEPGPDPGPEPSADPGPDRGPPAGLVEVRPPAWAGADQRAGARGAAVPRLAVLVAVVAGLLNFVSVLLPAERARLALLSRWVPGMVSRGATVATA